MRFSDPSQFVKIKALINDERTMNDDSDRSAERTEISMRRLTKSALPTIPILTEPLIIRHACVEESSKLAALLGRAYPTEKWEAAATEHELFHDESVKAPLVFVHEQRILATATLQIHSENPSSGRLRWVATEQDRHREGLAQELVISVLKAAAYEGCQEVRLSTTTDLPSSLVVATHERPETPGKQRYD